LVNTCGYPAPRAVFLYSFDTETTDLEHLRDLSLGTNPTTQKTFYPHNILFGQSRLPISHAIDGMHQAGARSMDQILVMRDPLQVLRPVVPLVPVLVGNLQAFGLRFNEGISDKLVNEDILCQALFVDPHE
jgi:hypothetical protein